jgi:hypothetical protein
VVGVGPAGHGDAAGHEHRVLGFVAGAVGSATTNLADLIAPAA